MIDIIIDLLSNIMEGLFPAILDRFKTLKKYKKRLKFIAVLILLLTMAYTIFVKGVFKRTVDLRIKFAKTIIQFILTFSSLMA